MTALGSTRFVQQLTEEHNHSHMDICSCYLEYYYNEELQLHHHLG